MFNILSQFQKRLSLYVPLFMGGGFITGLLWKDPSFLRNLILPLTFLMVYPMMVTMPFKKVVGKGDGKVQWAALMINFGVIPFVALLISRVFFADNPYLALGIFLVSLLPTSGMTISWTGMSKGNMPAAVKMTIIGLLLGSFLTPFYIKAFMGTAVSIPLLKIFTQIAVIVVLPMIFGILTQALLVKKHGTVKFQKEIKKRFPPVSTLGVLLMVFSAMALKAKGIAADPSGFIKLIPSLLLLYGVNFILSTVVAKAFFNRGDGLALVYGTVLRNLSIALAIAMTSFGTEGSQIALIIALGYIIQIQLSAWYVKLSPRLFKEKEELVRKSA